jgi:hypothetical protein
MSYVFPKQADEGEEPAPCDGCARAARCAAEQLACTAFERFNAGLRWQISPRCDASRERFDRIFGRGS